MGRPTTRRASRVDAQTKGERTRERIREAVVRLVSQKGPSGVTLQDICEETDITHGGFYFHFASKEAAMVDVAQEWIVQFKRKVLDAPETEEFFDEIHGMILTYIVGYRERIEVTRLVYALDPNFMEIRQAFTVYQRQWWNRLEALFRKARRRAKLPSGMEVCIVHSLTAALEGMCVDTYLVCLPELADMGKNPLELAERMAVIWHRAVLGVDPDASRLKYIRREVTRG